MTPDLPLPLDTTVVSQQYPRLFAKMQANFTWLLIQTAVSNDDYNEAYSLLFKFFEKEEEPVEVNKYGNFWGWNDLDWTYDYPSEAEAKQAVANRKYLFLESKLE